METINEFFLQFLLNIVWQSLVLRYMTRIIATRFSVRQSVCKSINQSINQKCLSYKGHFKVKPLTVLTMKETDDGFKW